MRLQSRREEEKQKEEEKDEDTEMTSNFLLFGLLGLAALIRFVCKASKEGPQISPGRWYECSKAMVCRPFQRRKTRPI